MSANFTSRLVLGAALLIALGTPISSAHAGAWLQQEGSGYSASTLTYFSGDEFFDLEGNRQPQDRFSKPEANYYIEYGALEWLTVGANLFVNQARQGGKSNLGTADNELFAKVPLITYEGFVTSLQPLIKLPSRYEDNDGIPRAGSRSTDAELSLLISKPYPLISDQDFLDTRIGYRSRSRHLGGQIRTDVSYAIYVLPELAIIPAYRTILSTDTIEDPGFSQNAEQDFDLHRIELGISWQWCHSYALLANVHSHIMGANTGAGEGITLGIARRF